MNSISEKGLAFIRLKFEKTIRPQRKPSRCFDTGATRGTRLKKSKMKKGVEGHAGSCGPLSFCELTSRISLETGMRIWH